MFNIKKCLCVECTSSVGYIFAKTKLIHQLRKLFQQLNSGSLLLEIVTEEASDLLSITLVHAGRSQGFVAGLGVLCLTHLHLPLCFEDISVGLAHVVQNAAGQHHGGHHVQPAVVPLTQALPARPEPQQRLLRGTQRSAEAPVEQLLRLRQRRATSPSALLLRIGLHEPALERVACLPQQHIPADSRWVSG